jgi:membrane protein YqaA with SNARE-associated domain
MTKKRNVLYGIGVIVLVLFWSLMLYFFPPSQIIDRIGVTSGLLGLFLISFIGGTSILFPFPYYLVAITLAASGTNPLLVGLAAGLGVILGDSTSYFVGYTGKHVISNRLDKLFNRIREFCEKKGGWTLWGALLLYGTMVPVPNDVIVVSFGLMRYRFWSVMIPLGIGNILFNTWVATLAFYGYPLFFGA